MSIMTSKIVTMICEGGGREKWRGNAGDKIRTVVMTLTMVMITLAIAPMMALMPRPMAENIEPYRDSNELAERQELIGRDVP